MKDMENNDAMEYPMRSGYQRVEMNPMPDRVGQQVRTERVRAVKNQIRQFFHRRQAVDESVPEIRFIGQYEIPEPAVPKIDDSYLLYLDEEKRLNRNPIIAALRPIFPDILHRNRYEDRLVRGFHGSPAVYGLVDGKHAIHGPVYWDQFNWNGIKGQINEKIPDDKPLPPKDIKFLKEKGFKFIGCLGKGGYGEVWRVSASKLRTVERNGKEVFVKIELACKVLKLSDFTGLSVKQALEEIKRESDIQRNLNHPNLTKTEKVIHLFDQKSGFPEPTLICHFMELCDGDLKSLIWSKQYFLTEKESHQWFIQIAEGLRYLHDRNVVHMDIKPHNILYKTQSPGFCVYKLTDFGISLRFRSGGPTTHNERRGTPVYMAPEISVRGYETKPTDIYSLGVCLVESNYGGYMKIQDLLAIVQNWTPNIIHDFGLTQQLANLFASMLQTDPKRRITIQQVLSHPWTTTQP